MANLNLEQDVAKKLEKKPAHMVAKYSRKLRRYGSLIEVNPSGLNEPSCQEQRRSDMSGEAAKNSLKAPLRIWHIMIQYEFGRPRRGLRNVNVAQNMTLSS